MKYQVAMFDLDGTILDTIEDLMISVNVGLSECGYPTRTLDEVRRFVGNGVRKLVERAVPAGSTKEEEEAVFSIFTEHYRVHCADHAKPYPGILELFEKLKQAGVRIAVVSNKPDYGVQSLCQEFFAGYVAYAAGNQDGIARKPDPQPVQMALDALGVTKEQAVYIGDSEVDIATARNCEMDGISVDWGFRPRRVLVENGATKIVSTAEVLWECL